MATVLKVDTDAAFAIITKIEVGVGGQLRAISSHVETDDDVKMFGKKQRATIEAVAAGLVSVNDKLSKEATGD